MTYEEIRARLEGMAEPDFRDFSAALVPGCGEMLGVRLPALRGFAQELVKSNDHPGLPLPPGACFEETMLLGMVIGAAKMPLAERLEAIARFVPLINNWSVCDSFCAGIKTAKKEQAAFFQFLVPYLESGKCYEVRFGLVMLLDWFINEAYIDRTLERLAAFRHPDYYAQMAAAWAISIAYIKFPQKTLPLLMQNSLDDFTHNKAIQKIRESRRVPETDKRALLALKRKKALP